MTQCFTETNAEKAPAGEGKGNSGESEKRQQCSPVFARLSDTEFLMMFLFLW